MFKDSNEIMVENCTKNCHQFQVNSQESERKSYHMKLIPTNQNFTLRLIASCILTGVLGHQYRQDL